MCLNNCDKVHELCYARKNEKPIINFPQCIKDYGFTKKK